MPSFGIRSSPHPRRGLCGFFIDRAIKKAHRERNRNREAAMQLEPSVAVHRRASGCRLARASASSASIPPPVSLCARSTTPTSAMSIARSRPPRRRFPPGPGLGGAARGRDPAPGRRPAAGASRRAGSAGGAGYRQADQRGAWWSTSTVAPTASTISPAWRPRSPASMSTWAGRPSSIPGARRWACAPASAPGTIRCRSPAGSRLLPSPAATRWCSSRPS